MSEFDAVAALAGLGHVLHQSSRTEKEAGAYFQKAEDRLKRGRSKRKHLFSLQGFRYCELLVEDGRYREVLKRSSTLARRARHTHFNTARGLGLVMRAKALYLALASHEDLRGLSDNISAILDEGIRTLQDAGQQEFHVFGLLCRACFRECHYGGKDMEGCRQDLNDAWEIAERGPMKLFMADIHLCRARLSGPKQQKTKYPWESPQVDLAEARRLIEECGYHRRDRELADTEEAARRW